jgi:response regulator RpfG family c-di-GMP phosphodiesterase
LVDDEKDILDLFNEYLSSNGYNVISFNNPIYALEYFYQNISNCSVVITDYKMPQMSGIDFIKKIREKEKNTAYKIKTIIISAFIKDSLPYDKSYIKMVDRILEKPVYLDRLKKEVDKLTSINIHQKSDRNKKNK